MLFTNYLAQCKPDATDNKRLSIQLIFIKFHAYSSLLSSAVDNKLGCSPACAGLI